MTTRRARGWSTRRAIASLMGLGMAVFGSLGIAGTGPASAAGEPGRVHAPIVGSGSTWSAHALEAWISNVQSNYQWRISYSQSGSSQGRNDFKNGTADFGVSEIPYGLPNSNEGDPRPPRGFAYMPIVAGGTAFMYNLEIGGRKVTNLRLSGETLALIFTGEITRWDDGRIKEDNPGLAASLPATAVIPVVRSDGSGTSAQFTMYMRQQFPGVWDAHCGRVNRPLVNGHCGVTSNYPPRPGGNYQARAGANGVAGYVAQSHAVGAITFVEYAYALNSGFPVAKVLNQNGYYTEPTAANVAVALLSAQINQDRNSVDYLVQDLSQVYTSGDPRTYPLSSYSYIILPTDLGSGFTRDKGRTLADFGAYFLCEGQQSAETLGYSPLPINLVQAGQEQIQRVEGGDPAIKTIQQCNNPTFSPDGTNRLANEAPMPPDCDRKGPTQCTAGTGGAAGTDTPVSSDAAGDGAGTGGPGADGAAGSADGELSADSAMTLDGAPVTLAGSPQDLPLLGSGMLAPLAMATAGASVLAMAVLPPVLGRRSRETLLPSLTESEGAE